MRNAAYAAACYIHTYIHFYLLKNEVKANNIYKLSTTNEQDNKAASLRDALIAAP